MNAWNLTPEARARKRRAARVFIALSVIGEGICLWRYGAHADFMAAYLIVSAWVKDTLHRISTEVRGHLHPGVAPLGV